MLRVWNNRQYRRGCRSNTDEAVNSLLSLKYRKYTT